jgi:hypothetical protein
MNQRRRRNKSPRERERRDQRFRQDIERIRAAKGLPPLEPTRQPEQEQETSPIGDTPPRPTPRQPTRQREPIYCPQCREYRDPIEFNDGASLTCYGCRRGKRDPGPTRLAIRGVVLD